MADYGCDIPPDAWKKNLIFLNWPNTPNIQLGYNSVVAQIHRQDSNVRFAPLGLI